MLPSKETAPTPLRRDARTSRGAAAVACLLVLPLRCASRLSTPPARATLERIVTRPSITVAPSPTPPPTPPAITVSLEGDDILITNRGVQVATLGETVLQRMDARGDWSEYSWFSVPFGADAAIPHERLEAGQSRRRVRQERVPAGDYRVRVTYTLDQAPRFVHAITIPMRIAGIRDPASMFVALRGAMTQGCFPGPYTLRELIFNTPHAEMNEWLALPLEGLRQRVQVMRYIVLTERSAARVSALLNRGGVDSLACATAMRSIASILRMWEDRSSSQVVWSAWDGPDPISASVLTAVIPRCAELSDVTLSRLLERMENDREVDVRRAAVRVTIENPIERAAIPQVLRVLRRVTMSADHHEVRNAASAAMGLLRARGLEDPCVGMSSGMSAESTSDLHWDGSFDNGDQLPAPSRACLDELQRISSRALTGSDRGQRTDPAERTPAGGGTVHRRAATGSGSARLSYVSASSVAPSDARSSVTPGARQVRSLITTW